MLVTSRSRAQSLNFVKFCFEVCKIIHHPILLFSLVNMFNILFYTIFTHAGDLDVEVTDLDIFMYDFL